jgi:hypothetical protein
LAILGFFFLLAIFSPFRKGGDSTATTAVTSPVVTKISTATQPSVSDLAEAWAKKYELPTATPEAEAQLGPVAAEKPTKPTKSAKPTKAKAKASKKTSD